MSIIRIGAKRFRVHSSWFLKSVYLAEEDRFKRIENPLWSEYTYYFVLEYKAGADVYVVMPGAPVNFDESELGSEKYPVVGALAFGEQKKDLFNWFRSEKAKYDGPRKPNEVLYFFEEGKYEDIRNAILEIVHLADELDMPWLEYDQTKD